MSIIITAALFITSLLPLWISVLFIEIKSIAESTSDIHTEIIAIAAIVIANVISVLLILVWVNQVDKVSTEDWIIEEVKEEKAISAEYLLSYILPLFAFDFTRWDSVVLFLIFFMTLMFICIRHNHLTTNILLEVIRYTTYSCALKKEDSASKNNKMVISKANLSLYRGRIIHVNNINNEYCFATPLSEDGTI